MLKCKYNEDCSRYPACGHTCGVPLEELLWRKCHQIRDLEFRMKQANFQVETIQRACLAARKELDKEDYIPTCPCGFDDCIHDPAYIRCYNPKHWEELGMPVSCDDLRYGESPYEVDERHTMYCRYYDDEDK